MTALAAFTACFADRAVGPWSVIIEMRWRPAELPAPSIRTTAPPSLASAGFFIADTPGALNVSTGFHPECRPPASGLARHLVQQDGHISLPKSMMWDMLFARQVPYLGTRIVTPFLDGISRLGLDRPGIPDLDRLNGRLDPPTGWRCVSVPGLVPDAAFFGMLAEKAFPIGNFIRSADSLDYLEGPTAFTTYSAMCRCWPISRWRE